MVQAKYDVFISYSRKDTAIANRICEALDKQGISYFIDRQGIGGGQNFPKVLAEAIIGCRIMLYLASANSYKSKYTNKEINFAFNKKPEESILPYIIDESCLPDEQQLIFANTSILIMKEHPIDTILVRDLCELLGREYREETGGKIEKKVKYKSFKEFKTYSSKDVKAQNCQIPTRLDLAGTWIDQPYVSCFAPGWAITISLVPDFEIRDRCGLSTSTRKQIQKIWPMKLPDMDAEMLAKLVFSFENDPERSDGIISGAQDAIGICVPGLCRHYYDARFWPDKIEQCQDERVICWLESHLCLIPMFPRRPGCSVIEGKDITEPKVKALAQAADDCWNAIMRTDLQAFATAYKASFNAQVAMFPAMIQPGVQEYIDRYSAMDSVLAWKMPGAGGGGYLALVIDDAETFCQKHEEAIPLTIRR